MDIATQLEILLREAAYETCVWSEGAVSAVCFEDEAIMGFAHVFSSADELLRRWSEAQRLAIAAHVSSLRLAPGKFDLQRIKLYRYR